MIIIERILSNFWIKMNFGKGINKYIISLALFFLLPIFNCAQAQSISEAPKDKLNVVLLLDSSASMLVNDPSRLRLEGAKLLLQFLKSGDSLAVVSFDQDANVVRPLSSFSTEQVPALVSQLNSIEASGQFTDLNAGLLKAVELLKANASDDLKPVIVLLSDGRMDPAPSRGTTDSHLDSLSSTILPTLKKNAFNVYTLAFSADADRALLQHIAQASDGINWFTPNSETIHESFADLFLSLKKPQVLPMGSKGFKIEANIDEATFYVNQKEGVHVKLEDPNQYIFSAAELADNMRWFDSKKFSVITISNPDPGDWKLIGVDPDDGFATILTNLKLVTDWPNAIPVGEKAVLRARLYEGKLPVDLQAISEAVTFAFQVTPSDRVSEPVIREFLNDEGKSGDETASDGTFSQEVQIDSPGEYRLRVLAKGPTFERQLQIPFRVRPPLVHLEVTDQAAAILKGSKTEAGHEAAAGQEPDAHKDSSSHPSHDTHLTNEVINGSNAALFEVALNEEVSTFRDLKVTVVAIDKKRNKYSLEAKAIKENTNSSHADAHSEKKDSEATHKGSHASLLYAASSTALPADGLYEIKAILEAKTREGKLVEEESETLKFNRKTVIDLTQMQVEVKPVQEHKPEVKVEVKDSVFDILSLIIVTCLNLALGAGLYLVLKKSTSTSSDSEMLELPQESEELKQKIQVLEKLVVQESVDTNDARFKVEIHAATQVSSPADPESFEQDASGSDEPDAEAEGGV